MTTEFPNKRQNNQGTRSKSVSGSGYTQSNISCLGTALIQVYSDDQHRAQSTEHRALAVNIYLYIPI